VTLSGVYGQAGDVAVPGDYDGDGKADFAVWRASDNMWWVSCSTGGLLGQSLGVSTDVRVPRDYDGDGRTDFAIFTPSTGAFTYISSRTRATITIPFGYKSDVVPQATP